MSSKIPPLISPYVTLPPESSLILLTSVLGASNNWLILRYIYACIGDTQLRGHINTSEGITGQQQCVAVVLVSWMRDYDFWKTEARRAVGLDLARLQQDGRFIFIDGLTMLLGEESSSPGSGHANSHTTASAENNTNKHHYLTDISSPILSQVTKKAISNLPPATKALLMLDSPTLPFLMSLDPHAASNLSSSILDLRAEQQMYACVVSVPADNPLVRAAKGMHEEMGTAPPLEIQSAAFVVDCVQQARYVVSCSKLGTGWAGDVSGVIRVTRGGSVDDDGGIGEESVGGDQLSMKDGEWLYHVGGAGGVRVWSRGEG